MINFDDYIIVLEFEDWVVYYANGKKQIEGHSVPMKEVLSIGMSFPNKKTVGVRFSEDESEDNEIWDMTDNFIDMPRYVISAVVGEIVSGGAFVDWYVETDPTKPM